MMSLESLIEYYIAFKVETREVNNAIISLEVAEALVTIRKVKVGNV